MAGRGKTPFKHLSDLSQPNINDGEPLLTAPSFGQSIVADYRQTGLSLAGHPLQILRPQLNALHVRTAAELKAKHHGAYITTAGLVIGRQRPGSAKGVMFITLEDETGYSNIVVWKSLLEKQRPAAVTSRLLLVKGQLQLQEGVLHLVARQLEDLSRWVSHVPTKVRSFH